MATISTTLVTGATAYPVTIEEIKHEFRIDHKHDDSMIETYIATATELCEHELSRQIKAATWDMFLDEFPSGRYPIELRYNPVSSVTSVTYYDVDNASQTWASSKYDTALNAEPARIMPIDTESYPDTYSRPEAVTVRFVTGYATVPPTIKTAVRILVGNWYDARVESGVMTPGVIRLLDASRYTVEF